ncbi:MAG: serine/threonine protein kinase [Acidobacteria bacterium]|nr:serine/threonine protein kinase [Acidobacteriota bacterium]
MTPEQYQRVSEIFGDLIECAPEHRVTLLDRLCLGDQEIRSEVESLLGIYPKAEGFIEKPLLVNPEFKELLPSASEFVVTQTYQDTASSSGQSQILSINNRYTIERELGRGGNGIVYLARDQQLHGRPVVVKVMLEKHAGESWATQMFQRESEALARISHPGVVTVLDRGTLTTGQPFFVMEFVKGQTLRACLKPGPHSLQWIGHLVLHIGKALQAAHREGVFHRDLKPENIMLEDLGEAFPNAKLIDFGIAKVSRTESDRPTLEGMFFGTMPYMAPEQLDGSPCSAQTDVFALAIIACELLTGTRPYLPTAEKLVQAIHQMLQFQELGPAEYFQLNREQVPPEVIPILTKALAFQPEHRYPSAEQFGAEFSNAIDAHLQASRQSPTLEIEPVPTPINSDSVGSRWLLWSSLMGIIFAGGLLLAWNWAQPAVQVQGPVSPRPAARQQILSIGVEAVSSTGVLTAGEWIDPHSPIPANRDVVFHVVPETDGWMYLIAPSNNVPTAFLTDVQSDLATSNQVKAHEEFVFPQGASIGLDGKAATTTFTIIFSPVELTEPSFLKLPPGTLLSPEQQRELVTFVERHQSKAHKEPGMLASKPITQLFTTADPSMPVVIEITLSKS